MEDVHERNMSQFREGSFGRLSRSEGGIPVYRSTVRIPDCFGGRAGGWSTGRGSMSVK